MNKTNVADDKTELRQHCYQRRKAIDAAMAKAAADALAERVSALLEVDQHVTVSAYWPLPGEIDPRPALLSLTERGAAGALPRTVGAGQPLDFHAWQPGDRLIEGRFKVMEPAPDAALSSPTLLLLPLLAFDQGCRRLGYGKGYYDRSLQRLRAQNPAIQAVGVAFEAQRVERVPTDEFDQTLDMVITEKAVYRPI